MNKNSRDPDQEFVDDNLHHIQLGKHKRRDLTICVDMREKEYYGWIKRLLAAKYPDRSMDDMLRSEELTVGDIVFKDGNGELFGYMFESKTGADLSSSIIDKRLHQQKGRMLLMAPKHNIVYLLVGDFYARGAVSTIGRLGAVTSTVCGDGCQAVRTEEKRNAALFVVCQHAYLESCEDSVVRERAFDFGKCLAESGSKREFETDPANKLESLLQKVPSISSDKARGIRRVYPTWTALQSAYRDCEGDPDDLLSDIQWRGGRIGPAASKAVCDYYEMRAVWGLGTVSDRNARKAEKRAEKQASRPSVKKTRFDADDTEDDDDDTNRWGGGDFANVFKKADRNKWNNKSV